MPLCCLHVVETPVLGETTLNLMCVDLVRDISLGMGGEPKELAKVDWSIYVPQCRVRTVIYYYYFKCTMCNSTLGCTHPMQH